MKPMAALAQGAWLASSLPAWRRFRHALCHPEATQLGKLSSLLRTQGDCAYGRTHRFGEICNLAQFRARVPIVTYDELAPWITHIQQGESAVLTRDPVTRLLPTSGSTGGRKLIPFTPALQREWNAAIGPWMVNIAYAHPQAVLGTAYWSISPALPAPEEDSAIPIGFDDDSAYLGGVRQRLVEAALAVPSALRLVSDLEDFRYLTLLCLLRQRELSLASVWHPSFLTLLLDTLPTFWAELLDDVAYGGCRRPGLSTAVRCAVAQAPAPQRARELRQFGPHDPLALWPHWRFVSCWGDAQAALPLAALRRRLPGIHVQAKGLLATEAFVTFPYRDLHPVALATHFFEFEDTAGKLYLAHELRPDQTYQIIVTTAGGLWRYRLGDEVEVNGWLSSTPSLRFLGRGALVSDLCGEKLTEAFVTTALQATWSTLKFTPGFALLAPDRASDSTWRYVLFLEGESPPLLADTLEAALRRNPHYALARDLRQLAPLVTLSLPPNSDEVVLRAHSAGGRKLGDIKPTSLSAFPGWRDRFNAES